LASAWRGLVDAARYSDTNGYQGDDKRTMWPWRDWVVQAFTRNLPYDQFNDPPTRRRPAAECGLTEKLPNRLLAQS